MKPEAETLFLAGLRCARYLRARDRPDFAWNFFVPRFTAFETVLRDFFA